MTNDSQSLIARYLAGEPIAGELLQACESDSRLLAELCDQVLLDRLLAHHGREKRRGEDRFTEEVIARLPEAFADEPFVGEAMKRIGGRRRHNRWQRFGLAASMAAVLSAGAWYYSSRHSNTELKEFATVIAVESSTALAPAARVGPRPVVIDRGFVQLRFDHGTVLLVEGPARFEIVADKRVIMDYGRAVATVPEAGHGFVVESPHAEIVDYGTQFGVEIDPDADTEVHVMRGEVRVHRIGEKNYIRLLDNQALRFAGAGRANQRLEAQAERFLMELPETDAGHVPNYLHWSLDEGRGIRVRPMGRGMDSIKAEGILLDGLARSEQKSASTLPKWIPGVFGNALRFGGNGASVSTDFSGIAGSDARTVSFWVKASPEDPPGYAAMGWGTREEGAVWQISLNPQPRDGVVGALRLGIMHGSIVGDVDLRDNRWHHVAVVMYPGQEGMPANLRTHVLLYVDGEMAGASRRSVQGIDTRTDSGSAIPLVIGRSATEEKVYLESFRGALDEIYVVDKALSREEIQGLMSKNALD